MADIKQAIEFAKQNPDSPFASELRKRIESGSMDTELASAGIGRPNTESIVQKNKQSGIVATIKDIPSDIADTFKGAVNDVSNGLNKVDEIRSQVEQGKVSPIAGTLNTIGAGLKAGAGVVGQAVVGAGKLFTSPAMEQSISNKVGAVSKDVIESAPVQTLIQKYNSLSDEQKAIVDGTLGTAEGLTTMFGLGPVSRAIRTGVSTGVKTAENVAGAVSSLASDIKPVVSDVINAGKNSADNVFESASNVRNNIKSLISEKNVNPQLKASAERLFLDGTKRLENPVATYDKYLEQSKKALTDVKADPAVAEVGSNIGDAFNTVVAQKRAVGSVLGNELKANGGIKINVSEPKYTILSELENSGLSYNPKTNSLTSFQGTKFAPEEISMLNDFVKGVNGLGDNPTVSAIDNFISKTRTKLKFAQGESGVIGTTNAERIINGGLDGLKGTLNPSVNKIKSLSKYWEANNAYSDLSNFVDEGVSYLGKITQSGDFVKDASIAKSSVQSVLNGGKKDWLVRLEALTGYKALDEAVLALQAMKDAGDFRGTSLLQAISEGSIPTSKSGFTQQVIDYAMQKGARAFAGTPEEQTRTFLKSLNR